MAFNIYLRAIHNIVRGTPRGLPRVPLTSVEGTQSRWECTVHSGIRSAACPFQKFGLTFDKSSNWDNMEWYTGSQKRWFKRGLLTLTLNYNIWGNALIRRNKSYIQISFNCLIFKLVHYYFDHRYLIQITEHTCLNCAETICSCPNSLLHLTMSYSVPSPFFSPKRS